MRTWHPAHRRLLIRESGTAPWCTSRKGVQMYYALTLPTSSTALPHSFHAFLSEGLFEVVMEEHKWRSMCSAYRTVMSEWNPNKDKQNGTLLLAWIYLCFFMCGCGLTCHWQSSPLYHFSCHVFRPDNGGIVISVNGLYKLSFLVLWCGKCRLYCCDIYKPQHLKPEYCLHLSHDTWYH